MTSLITITSDLGDSFAAAQLGAVLASLAFNGRVIENHDVMNFSILEGAFRILALSRFCPRGSVHLGVVDPGVGSERRGIVIQTNNYWFVGPDNGLLYPAANHDEILKVWKIRESKVSDHVSNTFYGRDVFIKVAVFLSQGKLPEDFHATPLSLSDIKQLFFQDGQVLHVDHYGNAKIHWLNNIELGGKLFIMVNDGKLELPIVRTFSDVQPGQPVALVGSSDTLEVAINLGNAAAKYSIQTGDIIEITDNDL